MVTVRRARASDAKRLAELARQLGYDVTATQVATRLPKLREPRDAVLCAAVDRQLVGWLHVAGRQALESEPFAEVIALVVDERLRSQGIGRALMIEAERWARTHRFRTMRVRSNVIRERAHGFYRDLGYVVTKTQHVFQWRIGPRPD